VPNPENAIVRLSRAIAAIDEHVFPTEFIASVRALFDGVTEITGVGWDEDDIAAFLPLLGGARQLVSGTLSDSTNLTMPRAGYKGHGSPQTAAATFDARFLPGHQEALLALLDELIGEHVEVIVPLIGHSVGAPRDGALVDRMPRSNQAVVPGSRVVPYCLS